MIEDRRVSTGGASDPDRYAGFLGSIFDVPTEPDLLRLIGNVLLLGSAMSWALLALGMGIAEFYGSPSLPSLASLIGVLALLAGWRFIPSSWPASLPILFQASVVYLFIAVMVARGTDVDLAAVWIVIWSATAMCVTTLAVGFVTATALIISGTLLLNILGGWLYPSSSGLLVPSMIGLAGASVIGIITHAVCFLMTRANSEAKQLDKVRHALTQAFARELDLPIAATTQSAINVGIQLPEAALLSVLRSHLTEVRRLLVSQGHPPVDMSLSERTHMGQILMASTSLIGRVATHRHISVTHITASAEDRLVSIPARAATSVLAFFCREAMLHPDTEVLRISASIEDADSLNPTAVFRLQASYDPSSDGTHRPPLAEKSPMLALNQIRLQVQEVNGALTVRPKFGDWLEVQLKFPVVLHDLSLEPGAEQNNEKATYQGMRFLLIEDEELTRLLTARNLERNGARVTQAANAAEALKALETEEFDAIIADLHLPDLSGEALISALRNYDAVIPIIVATVALGKVNIDELVAAGADQMLGKPLQDDQLQHAVALLRAAGRWS